MGGAGYIGSHTVYELIAAGENVVVVDNLETGFRKAVHQDAKFYQGDIRDKAFVRDYIHVNDLAQAHILAMEYLRKGNESNIFNLGNGVGFTVKEVVETARKVTGHPIPAKEEPRRAGDPSTLIASSEKAKKILGWKPKFDDLETIITTAWEWHRNHPNGYEV